MLIKHTLWIFLAFSHLILYANSEDEKSKREVWSSGSNFNLYKSTDDNKKDINDNFKSGFSPFSQVFSAIDSLGLKLNGNVKTTVEFWPPDMDKDKFYKTREEDAALTSWFNYKPLVKPESKVPEISYPAIFSDDNYKKHYAAESTSKKINLVENYEHYTFKPDVKVKSTVKPFVDYNPQFNNTTKYSSTSAVVDYDFNFQPALDYSAEYASTEDTLNYNYYNDAMTNSGPIVFPTIEPTTERTRKIIHQYLTYATPTASSSSKSIPRANKKRKLKKKVKTSSVTQLNKEKHYAVVVVSQETPPVPEIVNNSNNNDSSFDVIAETSSEHSPVYEIDNDSVHYTDIISNLSNLTELSFSSSNGTGNNIVVESDYNNNNNNYGKNIHIYNSKIKTHSTTPRTSFIINVEPEKAQDDVLVGSDMKEQDVQLSSTLSYNHNNKNNQNLEMSDLMKNSSKISGKLKKVINDNAPSFKLKNVVIDKIIESTSPISMLNSNNNHNNHVDEMSISRSTVQPTSTTVTKVHRSRFGIRKFSPRKLTEAPRIINSSTTANFSSSTVKSLTSKVVKSSSSEKPTIDMMHIRSTARYYTPKSRSRHNNYNNNNNNSSKVIRQHTTKSVKTTTIKAKIRRTTKKSSK